MLTLHPPRIAAFVALLTLPLVGQAPEPSPFLSPFEGPVEHDACTNILVARGASADGSVMLSYSGDAPYKPKLLLEPARDHAPGVLTPVYGWEDDDRRGAIPQVARTHRVVGLVNEHQLAICETTTGGRRELIDPEGLFYYDALMHTVLKRAKRAREAIWMMDALCREYGYRSSGETFSIADPEEAWMMEVIGKGPGRKGIVWVAARIPDGHISVHANQSRIQTFPLDDPERWIYAADVISFAREKGYYDPDSGEPFNWRDAYHGRPSSGTLKACAARVWSVLRRAAPSRNFSPDYHRAVAGARDYPLFVRPDRPLGVRDVMALMRDHFEGTPFDMTKGIAAGPFGSPYRYRPLSFEHEGQRCMWERPVSTQQAGFVVVTQARAHLPDEIGGVCWYTPDDCYTSVFLPLYCGARELPLSWIRGSYDRCTLDSAWWIFNLVSNLAYDRWSRVMPTIARRQKELEDQLFDAAERMEASYIATGDPERRRRLVTAFVVQRGEEVFSEWKQLWLQLLQRNVDGYVNARGAGYPAPWLDRVMAEEGERLRLPPNPR